jgi:hypothetical protein
MHKSSVETASKIMFAMGIYALVMSLTWVFLTDLVFVSDFLGYTGQSYHDFLSNNPKPAEIYMITKKLLGVMLSLISFLIIIVTQKSFSKGEKWGWYTLLVCGIIFWGGLLGYRVIIGYVAPSIVTFVIGAGLFVIGIILPAKDFLKKT